jgi:hypothetical protein
MRENSTSRIRSQAGFTLTEMLIASSVMIGVTAGVFSVLNPTQGTFQAQPEVADMQQRLRVAVDNLRKDLLMAGAGSYTGESAGALYNFFAPVMPYRRGSDETVPTGTCGEAEDSTYYCHDTITILYVPPTPAQTGVTRALGSGGTSSEIVVEPQLNCGPDKHDALCGFEEGMRVLIMDIDGTWDVMTLTEVQDEALHLQHNDDDLSGAYDSGNARITQVATHTYYLKADEDTETFQLMHYDGYETDLPIVDNVVDLLFEYFGDPAPPALLPGVDLTSTSAPWTTYGPKPPEVGIDLRTGDEYGDGENCVFQMSAGVQVPRLATLDTGNVQVKLDPANLIDGPWCPYADAPAPFDADLLRIRRVRVTLRVQVATATLRGPAGVLFTRGGTSSSAERFVPDQEIKFDITPRNMNLGR